MAGTMLEFWHASFPVSQACWEISWCLLGCVLVLVAGSSAGGLAFLVMGSRQSRESGVKYFDLDDNLTGNRDEVDDSLLPQSNVTDDAFGMDCNDAAYQEYFLRKVVRRVTNRTALRTPGTPQYQAFDWLVQTDAPTLCPSYLWDEEKTSLVQRYILAVFYFSTRGKGWRRCSAPDYFASEVNVAEANNRCEPLQSYNQEQHRFNNQITVSRSAVDVVLTMTSSSSDVADAWLTRSSECHWGGVSCDDFGNVVELDIGKLPPLSSRSCF